MADPTYLDWSMGNISSSLGNQFRIITGESTTAVIGLQAALTLGNKVNLMLDPSNIPPFSLIPGVRTVSAYLFGQQDWALSSKNDCTLNMKSSIALGGKSEIQPKDLENKALEKWLRATNALSTMSLLYVGFAGGAMAKDYASGNAGGWKLASSVLFSVTTLVSLVTLSLGCYLMEIKARLENMEKAAKASTNNEQIKKMEKEIKAMQGALKSSTELLLAATAVIGFVTVAVTAAATTGS